MKKNDLFSSLKDMMALVQIEEFCDGFNKKMKEKERESRKALIRGLIPLGIGSIVALITFNPLFFCLGVAGLSASAIIKMIKDGIEEERQIKEQDERFIRELQRAANKKDEKVEPEKIIDIACEQSIDEKLFGVTPIIEHKDSDFYTEPFKEKMAEKQDEISKDEKLPVKPTLEIIRQEKPLNKEETQAKIVHEYELYCIAYEIPTMNISPKEWDILFDTVYERLEELNITEEFYPFMNFLLKYVLAYSLISHTPRITVYSFIEKIPKLEIVGFDSREAAALAIEVDRKITPESAKVVNFKTLKFPENK